MLIYRYSWLFPVFLKLDESATSIDTTMVLSPEDVEAVARRTVELLNGARPSTFKLVGARELAGRLGVSVDYVYGHAAQLGAVRLGGGQRPRIRFDVETARRALEDGRGHPRSQSRRHGAPQR
jgi:hypothetical protein